jgi:hypothetical protein
MIGKVIKKGKVLYYLRLGVRVGGDKRECRPSPGGGALVCGKVFRQPPDLRIGRPNSSKLPSSPSLGLNDCEHGNRWSSRCTG